MNAESVHAGGVLPQLDRKSPPADGAFQVSSCRQSNGLQMEECVLPQGQSTRPLLRHCFSASLETSLALLLHHLTSQAAPQMAAMATRTATVHLHAWRERVEHVEVTVCFCVFVSEDNSPDEDGATLTSMWSFTRERCICDHNSTGFL